MLPRSERLTSGQFDRAFGRAQSVRHPLVVLRWHARGDGEAGTRAAFVVPKKQGKAHERNRVRRHLRERYRLHARRGTLGGCDLIFLSTPETGRATTEALDAALDEVLRRAGKKLGGDSRSGDRASGPQSRAVEVGKIVTETDAMTATTEANRPETAFEVAAVARLGRAARVSLALIRFYQRFISPQLPPSCRYLPTCSHYTYQAIERFGMRRGLWLGVGRVCRCHPLTPGGIDPVPEFFPSALSKSKFKIRRRGAASSWVDPKAG